MKILANRNRFSNLTWAGVDWVGSADLSPIGVDWIVYCGENVELLMHPSAFLPYLGQYFAMVGIEADSIHASRPDFPAVLGMPEFRDDFFVLRCSGTPAVERYANDFLAKWREYSDVSTIIHELGQEPTIARRELIMVHPDLNDVPVIRWGQA